jgi:thioredoxin reductase (NADPH)
LFVVDADHESRAAIESALLRRFASDFQVLTTDSVEAGLDALERLAEQGGEVALVIADLRLPGTDGVEFLERAHALHRGTRRALLIAMDHRGTRLPVDALGSLQRATALGQIDFSVLKGWVTPEEWLYPQVQAALTAWTKANRPRYEAVRVVGERWSPRSHELRDALARNTVPYGFYDAESDDGRRLLRDHGAESERLPVVILHDGRFLTDPDLVDVADALGVRTRPSSDVYDLAILGAGPAGLAAAVYGASEGLRTLIVEPQALGGQAGTSSMIRNYLGFPRGLSGDELTSRAYEQAMLFGAQFVFMQRAAGLAARGNAYAVALSGGSEAVSRAVIIATGVAYRRLGISALDRLIGAGVYYGAAGVEAPAMVGQEVYVVGGANSAGQAALHLAKFAARVTLLVRGESLETGMSDYLITELASTTNVQVRLRTRVVDGRGAHRLESLILEESGTGALEEVAAAGVFVLIGAETHTEWLRDVLQRDDRGYVLTGRDLSVEWWRLNRPPLPFETSMPGVFAAGDVRHGSVKRVAGAVGEGSVAVGSVHQYLAESAALPAGGD